MIIRKFIIVPIVILLLLFTSTFISMVSISSLPAKIMGSGDTYVLLSSSDRNPLRSNLDVNLAYELENMSYITVVSPEIFVFTVVNERAVTMRGVQFQKFLRIENGHMVKGSMPKEPMDAIVGEGLYNYMHLRIGEKLSLPGSFTPSIAVVNITGVFSTNTLADDEILVSLPTAQKLAGIKEGRVSIIRFRASDVDRADKLIDPNYPKFTANLTVQGDIYFNQSFNATINLINLGAEGGYCNLTLQFAGETLKREVYVEGNKSFNITLIAPKPGKWEMNLTVENYVLRYSVVKNVTILPKPVFFRGKTMVYANEPVNFTFLGSNSTPLSGKVLVKGEGFSKEYDVNGTATVVFPNSGNYTVEFLKEGYERKRVNVTAYNRMNLSELSINPEPVNSVIYVREGENITIGGLNDLYYSIDGGIVKESSGNISLPEDIHGDHIISIYAISNNSMGDIEYTLHIYRDGNVSAVSSLSSYGAYQNSSFNITIWSEIPLKNATLDIDGNVTQISIMQNLSFGNLNYTHNITLICQGNYMNISLYAENFAGYHTLWVQHLRIFQPADDEKPEIIIGESSKSQNRLFASLTSSVPTVRMWAGNTTTVSAEDNTKVVSISVHIFGRWFNSTGEPVRIPTVFWNGSAYNFVAEGTYIGTVNATDMYGNSNITEFEIIIDNAGERIAPFIKGETVLIFNDTSNSYIFWAFDNVGISTMQIYENSTLVKEINGNGANSSFIYLNSSDIADGIHHLFLNVTDVNNNLRSFSFIAVKNYTDNKKPLIELVTQKVWSGQDIEIKAKDDVEVKSISARIFGLWFNISGDSLRIPTMERNESSVNYTPEGFYSLNITVKDVFGNTNSTTYTVEVNNSGEKVPPVIFAPEYGVYNATDLVNITSMDNVAVSRIWVEDALGVVAESEGAKLSCQAQALGFGVRNLKIYAEDVNGNIATQYFSIGVVDNILPRVENSQIRMWGGNTTNITLWDNFGIKSGKLHIFGHEFYSQGNRIEVRTSFKEGENVTFIHNGAYLGYITLEDLSGNVNTSYITVIIDNDGERNPPVIIGETYQVVSNKTDAVFRAFDNVGISKMWWSMGSIIMGNTTSPELIITFQDIPLGTHRVRVCAEDVNGNVAMLNATIEVLGKPEVKVYAYLLSDTVETTERGMLTVALENGANPGNYTLTVYIDGEEYYNITESMGAFETKSITLNLPYLSKGEHRIEVGNQTLAIHVTAPPVEKLPIDLVLKYNKDLKVTASQEVIYKGFQISQGNFYLVTGSLITVGIILGALGMYSSVLKAMDSKNVAILRAIGASNIKLLKYATEDVLKYILPAIFLGVLLGYFVVFALEYMGTLRAFGHSLVVDITPGVILGTVFISLGFLVFTSILVLYGIFHSKVIHLMGTESSEKIYTLEEVLNER